MIVPMYNTGGEKVGEVELRAEIFEAPVNVALMQQALVRQLTNARLGTHKTKTRGEINRTKAKWYRQKGTGRARHGSRSPNLFVGGGVSHGPVPRDYRQRMPRKMRRAALRSALSAKAGEGQIVVLDELRIEAPKTKAMTTVLENLGLGTSVLILLPERDEAVEKSAHNLPQVTTLRAGYLNVRDLLQHDHILMPQGALQVVERFLG
jgi:large subunit ribosomal protein L4